MKKLLHLLWCITLLTSAAFAQYVVNTTDIQLFDNSPNYALHNLWHPMPVDTPQLTTIGGGSRDGMFNSFTLYGTDSAGQAWNFQETLNANGYSHSWTKYTTWGTDNKLIVTGGPNGNAQIWRLTRSSGNCGAGNTPVELWSGTSFAQWHGGCASQLVIADSDATAVQLNAAGNIYYSYTNGWIHLTGPTPFVSVAASSGMNIVANDPNGKIYHRDPAGTNTMVAAPIPNTPESLGRLSMDGVGMLWFLANTTGNSYVYDLSTGTWIKPIGYPASFLGTSGPMHTFAIVNGSLYRFTELGMQWTAQLTGNWNSCPPTGCPTGSSHTPTMHLEFASGSMGAAIVSGPAVPPLSQVNISATAKSWDTHSCVESGFAPAQCLSLLTAGTVNCSVMGSIFRTVASGFGGGGGGGGLSWYPQFDALAYTKALRLRAQPPQNCGLNHVNQMICDYPVIQNCTQPPDWWPRLVDDAEDSPGWYTFAQCLRWISTRGTKTPWSCVTTRLEPAIPTPSISRSTVCTSNP